MWRTKSLFLVTLMALILSASAVFADDCQKLKYQNQTFDIGGGFKMLFGRFATQNQAVRQVSDLGMMYLEESEAICKLYKAGKLSSQEYLDRREKLSQNFIGYTKMVEKVPLEKITDNQLPSLKETLAYYAPSLKANAVTLNVQVIAKKQDGQILNLQNNGSLNSGDKFSLQLAVQKPLYLYVVLKSSDGSFLRLYPAESTGGGNPVTGTVRIPTQTNRWFELDNVPGQETIYLFALDAPSPTLESTLAEVHMKGAGKTKQVIGALTSLLDMQVNLKGVNVVEESAPFISGISQGFNLSGMGQAAAVFSIHHQSN